MPSVLGPGAGVAAAAGWAMTARTMQRARTRRTPAGREAPAWRHWCSGSVTGVPETDTTRDILGIGERLMRASWTVACGACVARAGWTPTTRARSAADRAPGGRRMT